MEARNAGYISTVGQILSILRQIKTDFLLDVDSEHVNLLARTESLSMLIRQPREKYEIRETKNPILIEAKNWKKLTGFVKAYIRLVSMGDKPDILIEELESIGVRLRLEMSAEYNNYLNTYEILRDSSYKLQAYFTVPVSTLTRIKPFVKRTTEVLLTMSGQGGKIEFNDVGVSINIDIPGERVVVYDEGFAEEVVVLDPNIVAYIDRMSLMKNVNDIVVALAKYANIDTGFSMALVLPADEYPEDVSVKDVDAIIEAKPVG